MAFDTSALANYVEQNKSDLLALLVSAPKEFDIMAGMSGVVGTTTLNLLDTDIVFQNGASCGFNASGNDTLSQRNVVPGIIKVNKSFCPKTLLGTFAEHEVKLQAGKETLPYEEKIAALIINRIGREAAKAYWQGNVTSGAGNLAFNDGLATIIGADYTSSVIPSSHKISKSTDNVYNRCLKLIKAMSSDALSTNSIFMNKANFNALVFDIVALNNYHLSAEMTESYEMTFPFTGIKVYGVDGLAGVDKIYSLNAEHTIYAYNEKDDFTSFKMWYSEDDDLVKFRCNLVIGAQYAFSDEVYTNE